MAITVLLADDHTLVRAGLRHLLETLPDVGEVVEAGDGREALALVETGDLDVVLLDIAMPVLNGLDACARIRQRHPATKVIILSTYGSEPYVLQALRSGASGYLLKDSAVAELSLAIAAVLRGETFICSAVSDLVVERALSGDAAPAPLQGLTPRQREVLQLLAEGQSIKETAHTLGVSAKTVESHRRQIMERLAIRDVPGLVRFAMRSGLIPSDR